jgi:hypothetical protein
MAVGKDFVDGLLRAWISSMSFFFMSAAGVVSDDVTIRLLNPASQVPPGPGNRARPLDPSNPLTGWRVSR